MYLFYIWRLDLMILMQANSLLGPLKGVGPEISTFLGPNGTRWPLRSLPFQRPYVAPQIPQCRRMLGLNPGLLRPLHRQALDLIQVLLKIQKSPFLSHSFEKHPPSQWQKSGGGGGVDGSFYQYQKNSSRSPNTKAAAGGYRFVQRNSQCRINRQSRKFADLNVSSNKSQEKNIFPKIKISRPL
jgi:hypothetical protein